MLRDRQKDGATEHVDWLAEHLQRAKDNKLTIDNDLNYELHPSVNTTVTVWRSEAVPPDGTRAGVEPSFCQSQMVCNLVGLPVSSIRRFNLT